MMIIKQNIYVLLVLMVFFTHCVNDHGNKSPEIIQDIESWSMSSDSSIQLSVEAQSIKKDSLLLKFYLENALEQKDTLYHSSSFPLYIAYNGEQELTPPFKNQVIFDDLVFTVLTGNSKQLIGEVKIEQFDVKEYSISGVFNFFKRRGQVREPEQWLISNPIKISE